MAKKIRKPTAAQRRSSVSQERKSADRTPKRLSQMRIEVDTHTHTVLSGHAWSTLEENARAAQAFKLRAICVTEHAFELPYSTPPFFTACLRLMPASLHGVTLIPGMEFNILDFDGRIDVARERELRPVLFGIASMHDLCLPHGTKEDHTRAYCQVLKNPYIDILGHPGTRTYPCDIGVVVRAAKDHGKLIEINNNSFLMRKGGVENCKEFARQCKAQDVHVCVSSDAHSADRVGKVGNALEMLEELEFPPELILNLNMERFEAYLTQRKERINTAKSHDAS